MAVSHAELGSYAETVCRADSFDAAFAALERQVVRLGFEALLYTFIPRILLDADFPQRPVFEVSDGYDADYLAYYAQERFDRHDPIIKAIAGGEEEPLDWWAEVRKGWMNEDERRVIVSAREDFGIANGLTVPRMSNARGIAGVSVTSSESGRSYELLIKGALEELDLYTRMFHDAVQSSALLSSGFLRPLVNSLTKRERAVLSGLAKGEDIQQIADGLGTTVRYLDRVIRQLREKFSGTDDAGLPRINRNQLLYHIGIMDLLDQVD